MLDLSYSLKIKERYDRKGPGQPWTVGGAIKSVCVCMCVCVGGGGGGIGLANLWPCRTIEIDHAPGSCPPPVATAGWARSLQAFLWVGLGYIYIRGIGPVRDLGLDL